MFLWTGEPKNKNWLPQTPVWEPKIKMASSTIAWLSVLVKWEQRVLKNRTVVKANWEDPFSSLLAETEFQTDLVSKVVISKHESFVDPVHTVPLDAPVLLCSQFNCLYICFYLESNSDNVNAEVTLPKSISYGEARTLKANERLRNDVIGMWRNCKCIIFVQALIVSYWQHDNITSMCSFQ